MAGAALADAIFGALESEHSFSTKYWETQPLLVHRPELAAQLSALLSAADLPVLSERLEARDKVHQCMREGESCEPRELCWNRYDGYDARDAESGCALCGQGHVTRDTSRCPLRTGATRGAVGYYRR